MPPSDNRFPRKRAVLWGIAAFACAIVAVCWQIAKRRTAEMEQPPYHTMLELLKVGWLTPERLELIAFDLHADEEKPAATTVAIRTIDRGNRTIFAAIGEDLPGTPFTIESFQQSEALGGGNVSIPTVTIINKLSGAKDRLPLKRVENVAGMRGDFRYKWVPPSGLPIPDFEKSAGETFTLPPENGKLYKVISIKGRGAVIALPDGKKKLLTAP
jgi:hypothetical protein